MKTCVRCGSTDRYTRSGECRPCRNKRSKNWYLNNREQFNAHQMRYYRENPDKYRRRMRMGKLKKYGMTLEAYDRLFEKQGGVCAICQKPEAVVWYGKSTLAVDHDHTTGKTRGLLCFRCNTVLGKIGEDPVGFLSKILVYLNGQ